MSRASRRHPPTQGRPTLTLMAMNSCSRGFTMIELIVVIVIVGILAATALPRFVDLSGDANAAALKGIAATATGAMTVNYAGCAATSNSTSGANAAKCQTVRYCDDISAVMVQPIDATQYTISHTDLTATNGSTGNCTMTQVSTGHTLLFTGISAGNP